MKELSLLILFLLMSCQPSLERRDISAQSSSGSETPDAEGLSLPANTQWYHNSNYTNALTLLENNLDITYLRGVTTHQFLNDQNLSKNFCLSVTFNSPSAKELRVKATPITFTQGNKQERLFRINLGDTNSNALHCNLGIEVFNIATNSYLYTPPTLADLANKNNTVCSNCQNSLSSITVKLYLKRESKTTPALNVLEPILSSSLDLGSLSYRIDFNSSSSGGSNGGGTCTNSECVKQGFGCCLNNQCVTSGNLKPGADTAHATEYQQSLIELQSNHLAYLNYPQIYYICPQGGNTTGSTSGGSNGSGTETLNQIIKDDACIDELQAKSEATPFHLEPHRLSETYTKCEMTDTTSNMYFKTVMSRMYNFCGCSESTFTNQVSRCPYYIYQVKTTDNAGNPTQFACDEIDLNNNPPPLQTKVVLSSKTAPHRYFNTDGIEINPYKPNSVTNTTQEGDAFAYLDSAKTVPLNGSYNMNSILGQITTALDQARPAVSIDVKENTTYILSVTSGSYSTCPSCAKDSWYGSFSPFPSVGTGNGLSSSVYSTSRSSYDDNATFGNYEDTHFGRACFVPPTMIPFSHSEKGNAQTQRLNRLKTQAAFFVNGYQRDWFGFNRGAVIGSFDGVTWFALGGGRIVNATTNKLYLAINAPFADLANNSTHAIDIQIFDGSQSGTYQDFDTTLSFNHPNQNAGATCRAHHQCETDTDCITRLGWEYICSDIGKVKTKWPKFATNTSEEIAGESLEANLNSILIGGLNGSSKRCVYRGAGAPCRKNYHNQSDAALRKTLACAPNFYCADLTAGNIYNKEVARFAAKLEDIPASLNHYFGLDSNHLGRPLDYIHGAKLGALLTEQVNTINENLNLMDSSGLGQFGICKPGKAVATTNGGNDPKAHPFNQHKAPDSLKRTDYISQIAACDAGNYSNERVSSCPVLDDDGNYLYLNQSITLTEYLAKASAQNSCGLESLLNNTPYFGAGANVLKDYSAFKNIEGLPLSQSSQIVTQTHARDACLRRAGAVCHTNLDCSPSSLHGNDVGTFSDGFYGNTAEKNFWSESLICSQAKPRPTTNDPDYFDYDMSLNKCCRAHGTTLTMYSHKDTNPDLDPNTQNINPARFGASNPSASDRYSRYQVVSDLIAKGEANYPSADTSNTATYPITAEKQWRAIHETGKRTCCGGTWMRKFADGTTNWQQNRQSFTKQDFSCLNYSSPLLNPDHLDALGAISAADKAHVENYFGLFCLDTDITSGDYACAQRPLLAGTLPSRLPAKASAQVRSATNSGITNANFDINGEYVFHRLISADDNPQAFADFSNSVGSRQRNNLKLSLPGFILPGDILSYQYYEVGGSVPMPFPIPVACVNTPGLSAGYTDPQSTLACGSNCCYEFNPSDNTILFGFNGGTRGSGNDIEVAINFRPAGNPSYPTADMNRGMTPANFEYYTKRLERFELTGVPQITYMPLYCTNDYQRMVPGLFQEETLSDFQANGFIDTGADFPFDGSILPAENDQSVTDINGLDDVYKDNPVFSSYEFKCCLGLGQKTSSPNQCCSSFGVIESGQSQYTCKLPARTDLNLYFNKFISGEGLEETIGLDDSSGNAEFDDRTGYPTDQNTTYQKLIRLGEKYCESGEVRRGAAFGFFAGQPNNGLASNGPGVYSLVDSQTDQGTSSSSGSTEEVGASKFDDGFRWNNHFYCDD